MRFERAIGLIRGRHDWLVVIGAVEVIDRVSPHVRTPPPPTSSSAWCHIPEINWRLHISVANAKRNDLWVAGNENWGINFMTKSALIIGTLLVLTGSADVALAQSARSKVDCSMLDVAATAMIEEHGRVADVSPERLYGAAQEARKACSGRVAMGRGGGGGRGDTGGQPAGRGHDTSEYGRRWRRRPRPRGVHRRRWRGSRRKRARSWAAYLAWHSSRPLTKTWRADC